MAAEFRRTLPAASGEIPPTLDAIEQWLTLAAVPAAETASLMIAFDEILSNIVKYGGGTIDLSIDVGDRILAATIADDGPAFDPLAREAPDVELGIDERQIGGLGIHLVREMMDDVRYSHENGRNLLTLTKTF